MGYGTVGLGGNWPMKKPEAKYLVTLSQELTFFLSVNYSVLFAVLKMYTSTCSRFWNLLLDTQGEEKKISKRARFYRWMYWKVLVIKAQLLAFCIQRSSISIGRRSWWNLFKILKYKKEADLYWESTDLILKTCLKGQGQGKLTFVCVKAVMLRWYIFIILLSLAIQGCIVIPATFYLVTRQHTHTIHILDSFLHNFTKLGCQIRTFKYFYFFGGRLTKFGVSKEWVLKSFHQLLTTLYGSIYYLNQWCQKIN